MKNKSMLKTCTYFLIMVLVTMSILVACAEPAPAPTTPAPAPITKVTFAVQGEPQVMEPCLSRVFPTDGAFLYNIYEALVSCTSIGKPTSGIGIASWKISDDGKVIEFSIRKGVKFSNGDPLTARDVEFTHNRMMQKNTSYPTSMRSFDRLEVVDDYTIRFIFKVPDVLFIYSTGPQFLVVSKTYYDRVGEDAFASSPVGTGPYKFVEWKAGQYLDLVANENYWGGAPAAKQARLLFAAEPSTRMAMLKAGEVDIIGPTPWESVGEMEKAGFKIVSLVSSGSNSIQFHCLNPNVPWYDKRVRLAIACAVDRQAIVKNVLYGIPPMNLWLGPGNVGYDPDLKAPPYDPAKAKALLAEAGYPNGFEMPFYYMFGGAATTSREIVEAVTLYLGAVGIKCVTSGIQGPQMMESIRKWHNDPTAVAVLLMSPGMANRPDSINGLQNVFYSQARGSMYFTPQLDALIEKGLMTFDETQRAELIKQAYRLINEDMPLYQLTTDITVYAMKQNINYKPTNWNFPMYFAGGFS